MLKIGTFVGRLKLNVWDTVEVKRWKVRVTRSQKSDTQHRHVTCPTKNIYKNWQKLTHSFWKPWPKFVYSFCQFQGTKRKIKQLYWWKIAFIPLWRLESSLMCTHGIKYPVHRGSPKTARNNFWIPNFQITIQLLWATITIKGIVYIWAPPPC